MHYQTGHLDSFNMSQLGKSAASPVPRLVLMFSINITHPSFNNEFSGDSSKLQQSCLYCKAS